MKICFIASTGGHLEQLMMLRPLMNKYDSIVVTERTKFNSVKANYFFLQINRKEIFAFIKLFLNAIKSLIILLKEKPDVVITTGALSVIPICLLAKLFNKKVIYIESFAKVNDGTMTGKFLYKYVDVFIVQWEELLEIYPKAIYGGAIY